MANIKSQIKRNRQNLVRHERNKAVRSELKTRTKSAVDRRRGRRRRRRRAPARGHQAHRQGRRQGRDPQEPGGPAQVPAAWPGSSGRPRPTPGSTAHGRDRRPPPASASAAGRAVASAGDQRASSTRSSGHALPPRRSRSAAASRSMASHDPVVAQPARLAAAPCGPGTSSPAGPSSCAASFSPADRRPVELQHAGVVPVQRGHHLQGMAAATVQHAVQLGERRGDVAPVEGVGQLPRGDAAAPRPGTARCPPRPSWAPAPKAPTSVAMQPDQPLGVVAEPPHEPIGCRPGRPAAEHPPPARRPTRRSCGPGWCRPVRLRGSSRRR